MGAPRRAGKSTADIHDVHVEPEPSALIHHFLGELEGALKKRRIFATTPDVKTEMQWLFRIIIICIGVFT